MPATITRAARGVMDVLSQPVEMGLFWGPVVFCVATLAGLPRFAASERANRSLAIRCWGVCA
jgi:hypothetical protein